MGKKFAKVSASLLVLFFSLGLVALSGCSKGTTTTEKPQKDYILIGRVNPSSGPLAGFGEGTPAVEQYLLDKINQDGGIYIAEYEKKLPLKMITVDSESDPSKTAEATTKLILQDKVDLLIGAHTPTTVNPVASVAERNKMPTITLESPVEIWLDSGPHTWNFHAGFSVPVQISAIADIWDTIATNKKVGFMYDNADGSFSVAPMLEQAKARGYTVVDPGRFPVGTKDYSTLINKFKQEGVDIVSGNMVTPDFATAWKQFNQMGFIPKVVTISKTLLFPSDVAAVGGDLGIGLSSEIWWGENFPYKSALTGQTPAELSKWYSDTTGKQPTAVLGYKYAAIELAVDALKRAESLDKDKLREALKATNLDTIIGHIQFNDQNFAVTAIAGGQWVKGKTWPYEKIVINNKTAPEIPLSKEPMIYMPGSK